ncbi:unannotated protein [freshwater metagenome]|uniref:Unannotated protein n=1 Tax=freshwater metagenome TaxID=449393 RepID=A0A6J6I405_9ZZZZ|nr:hypothetical protein [Actinomycetota bacterium]MSZ96835.1 hypothetical protein [Actinomycetota bacterium]
MAGKIIVRINILLTLIFVTSSIVSAVAFSQPWKTIAVVVSLACFAVGITVFLWGYWSAVQRSREDNISVAAMYFLVDGAAPSRLAVVMNSTLAVQVVVAVATALSRSSTDGRPGSTLAFGILVPMMGLGFNGLWAAEHGVFDPRRVEGSSEMPQTESPNDKD